MQQADNLKEVVDLPRRRLSSKQVQLFCMLALTFSTGIADAIGFLGLDRVFTGNMTGNVVILGMALVGADDLPVVGPLIAFGSFLTGAALSGRILRGQVDPWSGVVTSVLFGISGSVTACSIYIYFVSPPSGSGGAYLVTGLISAAMGAQAAVARLIAVKDVTTVVVTSTMTGLAADSWIAGRKSQPWLRRVLAIVCIGLGALAGALLLKIGLAAGVAVSALIIGVVAIIGHRWGRMAKGSASNQ